MKDKTFLAAADVMEILKVGRNKAYEVIRELNNELADKGYRIVSGRVSVKYFNKRYGVA